MTRRIALLFAALILIAVPVAFAQEATPDPLKTDEPEGIPTPEGDLVAYAMENLAVFVPIGAEITSEWTDEASGQVLRVTATAEDGLIRYLYFPPSTFTNSCVPRSAPFAAGVLMSISPLCSRLKMKSAPPPRSSRGLLSSSSDGEISTVVSCSMRML